MVSFVGPWKVTGLWWGKGSELGAGGCRGSLPDAAIDTGFVIAQNSSVVIKDG